MPASVLFLGGLDAGKSTLARATAAFALRIGRPVAYIDADVAQKTVGPPATVGMKHIREPDDLILERMSEADALGFVGSISPQDRPRRRWSGRSGRLRDRARNEGAELLIVDTGGEVSGIRGQLVKYYKVDVLEPDLVVGLQRGEELEPILGVVDRFFGIEIRDGAGPPGRQAEQRRGPDGDAREGDGAVLRGAPLQRFRVQADRVHADPAAHVRPADPRPPAWSGCPMDTAGSPVSASSSTWPTMGASACSTPVAEPPKALRLGSVRLEDTVPRQARGPPEPLRNRVKGVTGLPSLIKKRRKKMRKKKHKKLLKRTRHQRLKLGK